MTSFRVRMLVQGDGLAASDLEIDKMVEAADEQEAIAQARALIRTTHPEVNTAKIWSWTVERERI